MAWVGVHGIVAGEIGRQWHIRPTGFQQQHMRPGKVRERWLNVGDQSTALDSRRLTGADYPRVFRVGTVEETIEYVGTRGTRRCKARRPTDATVSPEDCDIGSPRGVFAAEFLALADDCYQ